jgi:hypothetical protein
VPIKQLSLAVLSGILALLLRSIATQYRTKQVAPVVRIRGHAELPNRVAADSPPSREHRAAA